MSLAAHQIIGLDNIMIETHNYMVECIRVKSFIPYRKPFCSKSINLASDTQTLRIEIGKMHFFKRSMSFDLTAHGYHSTLYLIRGNEHELLKWLQKTDLKEACRIVEKMSHGEKNFYYP